MNVPGAAVIDFTGTQAYVVGSKGPGYGTMSVTLDGAAQPNVDLSAASAKYQQVVFSKTGLTDAAHRLVIETGPPARSTWTRSTSSAPSRRRRTSRAGWSASGASTPEYDWVESWKFRADGTYTYLVSNGSTTVREDGLYAAYQGASSKLLLLFDRWSGGSLSDVECSYWITSQSDGTWLHIDGGPNLDVNYLIDAGDVAANMRRSGRPPCA